MCPDPVPRALLRVDDHSRDSAGMVYVYPVVSRRAGGVSVGINLNVNNACNWRCAYCQVPNLRRGGPPPVDLALLERELRAFLGEAIHGRFMGERVPEAARRLMDVAFSGNGEPTSAAEFPRAVAVVARVMEDLGLPREIKIRLITNGSLIDRRGVQEGIALIGQHQGEVWFKVDAATPAGITRINGVRLKPETVARRLRHCASLCETWVQTCVFAVDGAPPTEEDLESYLALLGRCRDVVAGVHLYSLARLPMQEGAEHLSPLPGAWLDALAARIGALGLTARVSP